MIVTLDDPLEVAVPSDPHEAPGVYQTLLAGLHKTPTIISHPGRQSGIQLALEPLGARALLGLQAVEIANIDVPAADVLGPLEPARAVAPEVTEAWSTLRQSSGRVAINQLAHSVGWSSRHFGERFLADVGLSPKAAARVIRFDHARRELQRRVTSGALVTLADLAADTGYYDQAHLAREFRELAGCSPSQWVAEELRNFQAFTSDDGRD